MDGDGENGGVPPLPQHAHLRGPDGLAVELCHGSERFCRSPDLARDADLVDLVDLVARVQKMLHPFAVVRQKQQSLGVEVEPPDGIDARAAVSDELGDGLSPFFVRERADIAARLVEHQVALLPLLCERPAVDGNFVDFGVGLLPEKRSLAVHVHASRGDTLLGGATGAEPRFGDELLNSCFGQVDPSFTLPTEIARAFPPATYFCLFRSLFPAPVRCAR